ncbi:MAG: DUF4160 domain-containing protein [Muribaculum sp.]|nr:DUF4160 domain-containing protein [Muribaculum sp.]
MPTIFNLFGFAFMFYANDHEPIHVHVVKGKQKAKFTIFPVKLVENKGMKNSELKMVEAIIEENQEIIAEHWNRFFNQYK